MIVANTLKHSYCIVSIIKPESLLSILASLTQRSPKSLESSGAISLKKSRTSGKLSPKRRSSVISSSILITAISRSVTVVETA